VIAKPTVLILGAGASVDYNFPTGRKLLWDICQDAIRPTGKLFNFLTNSLSISPKDIEDFRQALRNSSAPSVDLFLENRKEFEEIGKLAIAATLIPYEEYDALVPREKARWYETLFHLMVEGGPFEDNKLSIITFNYDRSLEAFLFLSFQNMYGFDVKTALERLGKIPIVHLYGSLGATLARGGTERGYEAALRGDWITAAANRLKIVHEAGPGTEFETAQNLLRNAAEVIFLGFGFHYVNVQRLRIEEANAWHEDVFGTYTRFLACRTGMGDGDIARAQQALGKLTVEFAPSAHWYISDFLHNTECLMPGA
jgi:hypothetical protein